jgi:GT2 family glycosyltransferase
MINFSIIIPNYNGGEFITDCLYSLYQSIKLCSGNFEIIIVDNDSKDNSLELINDFFNQYRSTKLITKIFQLKTNTGFAGAVNFGINKAQYEYVVLCNNDLTLEPNWFQLISESINKNTNSKIATFFGTVLTKDGTKFESQGLEFFIRGKAKNTSNGKLFNKSTIHNLQSNKLVWGASAALVVYQKEIIQKIGLFDEDFFAYEEDVDVALRLSKLKYQTLYIPKAICYHLGGGTSGKMGNFRNRMDAKNWIYLIIKNYSAKEFWLNFSPIIEERFRNLSGLIKNTPFKNLFKDIFKTYGEVFSNLPKMLKKRQHLQKLIKSINL